MKMSSPNVLIRYKKDDTTVKDLLIDIIEFTVQNKKWYLHATDVSTGSEVQLLCANILSWLDQ